MGFSKCTLTLLWNDILWKLNASDVSWREALKTNLSSVNTKLLKSMMSNRTSATAPQNYIVPWKSQKTVIESRWQVRFLTYVQQPTSDSTSSYWESFHKRDYTTLIKLWNKVMLLLFFFLFQGGLYGLLDGRIEPLLFKGQKTQNRQFKVWENIEDNPLAL